MRKYYLLFAFVSFVFLVIYVLQITGNKEVSVKGDDLVIGIKGDIFGFFPYLENYETTTMNVNFNIFNALVEFNDDSELVSALAERWTNIDDLTWRFFIRKDVEFHNGEKLTAKDIKASLDYVSQTESHPLRSLLHGVSEVNIIDDYTVDIITTEISPVLLNRLADIYITSKKQIDEGNKTPVGTGSYKFVSYKKGEEIVLERFENAWKNKIDSNQKIGLIEKVTFKIITDDEDRFNALREKSLDIVEFVPASVLSQNYTDEGVKVVVVPSSRVIFLSFDFREMDSIGFKGLKNPVSDLLVRKAMYHAIDEDRIVKEVMKGLAEPASQFISTKVFGYNQNINRLEYNVSKAKELMKQAGYETGFEIELDCPNDRYINDALICENVAEQLKEINIDVKLKIQSKVDYFPRVLARNVSFYLLGWATDTNDGGELFDYILSSVDDEEGLGAFNAGFYSNEDVDVLTGKISTTVYYTKRRKYLEEGFKIAADDVVWIPLHVQQVIYGIRSDLDWKPRADIKIKIEEIRS